MPGVRGGGQGGSMSAIHKQVLRFCLAAQGANEADSKRDWLSPPGDTTGDAADRFTAEMRATRRELLSEAQEREARRRWDEAREARESDYVGRDSLAHHIGGDI